MGGLLELIKNNWKVLLLIFAVFAFILLIIYGILAFIAMFITWYGAILLMMIAMFFLGRKIAKFLVFPGHCNFFKRSMEIRFARNMAGQVVGQILDQRYALELVASRDPDPQKISVMIESNHSTYSMFTSIEYTLSRQRELGTITDDQEALLEKINALRDSFDNIKISFGNQRRTLLDLGPYGDVHAEPFNNQEIRIINPDSIRA
jgi:hypothetical protein